MIRPTLWQSVVFRLAAALVLGGVAISAALNLLERRNAETMLQIEVTQDTCRVVRGVQKLLRTDPSLWSRPEVGDFLPSLATDTPMVGMRLTRGETKAFDVGTMPATIDSSAASWFLLERALAAGGEVSITRRTYIQAPFISDGQNCLLEMVVDGTKSRADLQERLATQVRTQWLMLAVTTLAGMILLRRWVGAPLVQIMNLVTSKAGPSSYFELSRRAHGEFGELAAAISGMLANIEETSDALARSERAFRDLYELAPAAMLNIDANGNICEANPRAAALLGAESDHALLGQSLVEFVRPEDRGLLRQAIERLHIDPVTRCELRFTSGNKTIDAAIECAGVRGNDGVLRGAQLSMLDICESKQLQRQVANKSHLLNLVLDHISSAILLVDSNNKIAAYNQQLTALSHTQAQVLIGQRYDADTFWRNLGVIDEELFVRRLHQIELDHDRPAQERVETRRGTFRFQGIPVIDATGKSVGRLWKVQDVSQEEQHEKLLQHQNDQLQAIKRLGHQLSGVSRLDEVIERACQYLFEVFGVETVGIAVRRDKETSRSVQVIHRGATPMLLETNRSLVAAVEKHLMPDVLAKHDVSHWPELPKTANWEKAFSQAGLTSVAGAQLKSKADALGILWVARRGGEQLDSHHVYLLEALAPFIAGHFENAQLRERLLAMESADLLTGLPNAEQFIVELNRMSNRPGQAWSVVVLKLDHFRRLNELANHADADRVLCDVAKAIQGATRKSCVVGRLDGAMFAVLSPGGGLADGAVLGERLRKVVAGVNVVLTTPTPWKLTTSVGVAGCPDDGHQAAVLVRASDRADAAKRLGGNQVVSEGPDADRLAG